MSLYQIQNLTYYYPETAKPALQQINLTVKAGEFLLIAGGSGSGKSSLARVLAGLIPEFYGGKIGGEVLYQEQNIRELDQRQLAREVGIVFQDPEKQLVMTSVEGEIAFGLENIGLHQSEMFRRVAEVISFFGMTALKNQPTTQLSGGQKQKLALASVLAMEPAVLILDEPTSQLDPQAAEELFNLVKRLNEEMNLTIVLIEQRLERCFHLADRVVIMEQGRIVQDGQAGEVASWQIKERKPFVPPVAALFARCGCPEVPLTVKAGRSLLAQYLAATEKPSKVVPAQKKNCQTRPENNRPLLKMKNLWFSYPQGQEVLQGINFSVGAGEFVALLGENGAGKTTLLKEMVGLLKPTRGKVEVMGQDTGCTTPQEMAQHIGYLSQNPNDYLFQDTVEDELKFTLHQLGLADEGRIKSLLVRLGLDGYSQTNPRDLSSGERQRVALASVMVAKPQILLLDEPTRGMDYQLKAELGCLLKGLTTEGMTVILVTHDVEFVAEYADQVVLLFDGRVAAQGSREAVLGNSLLYAPQIGRLFRGRQEGVLTVTEGIEVIKESNWDINKCSK